MLNFIVVLGGVLACIFMVLVDREFKVKRRNPNYSKRAYSFMEGLSGGLSVLLLFTAVFLN